MPQTYVELGPLCPKKQECRYIKILYLFIDLLTIENVFQLLSFNDFLNISTHRLYHYIDQLIGSSIVQLLIENRHFFGNE